MLQKKEQDKIPEKELSKMEINNLPDKEFKLMIIKMLNELGRRIDKHSEKFNRELENIKKNQTAEEYNNWNKTTLEEINSRLDDTEEWMTELEDRVVEITQAEEEKEKRILKKRIL